MAGATTRTSDARCCTCGLLGPPAGTQCRDCAALLHKAAMAELACCVCRDVTVHSLHVCHHGHWLPSGIRN